MTVSAPRRIDTTTLLLADISGYTRFLETVQDAHPEMNSPDGPVAPAYRVISTLLDTVMDRIGTDYTLLQVEGDALFARATGSQSGADLLKVVRSAYGAFRERMDYAMTHDRCECNACIILPKLELKFVVHCGPVVPQRIAGRELIAGPTVNLAHRLLKNSITERTGLRAYVFVTDVAREALGMTPDFGLRYTEDYPDGPVPGVLIALEGAHP